MLTKQNISITCTYSISFSRLNYVFYYRKLCGTTPGEKNSRKSIFAKTRYETVVLSSATAEPT